MADFASGFAAGAAVGSQAVDNFARGFEGTRRLYIDAERKKAAQAIQAQLTAKQAEWDNQTALAEAELSQLEEDALVDGVMDENERGRLKARKAKLEMGRFNGLMDTYAQVLAGAPDNPYIEAAVKPLMEATASRFQAFYNQTAQEFEEFKLRTEQGGATSRALLGEEGAMARAQLSEEGAMARAQLSEAGARSRQTLEGEQRLEQIGASGQQDRMTWAMRAGLGAGPGSKGLAAKPIDPLQVEDLARANVESKFASQIAAGSMTPEAWDTAMRMERRTIFRTYNRAAEQMSPESLMDPAAPPGEAGPEEAPEDRARRTRMEALQGDIAEVEAQIAAMDERRGSLGKREMGAHARNIAIPSTKAAGEAGSARAERATLANDLKEARGLLQTLKDRLAEEGRANVGAALEKDRAAREAIAAKYGK